MHSNQLSSDAKGMLGQRLLPLSSKAARTRFQMLECSSPKFAQKFIPISMEVSNLQSEGKNKNFKFSINSKKFKKKYFFSIEFHPYQFFSSIAGMIGDTDKDVRDSAKDYVNQFGS